VITSGTLRRQAQKGIAFRTPGMPGLRPPDEHARQRSDTVRAPVAATPIGTADPLCKTYGKVEAKASSSSLPHSGQAPRYRLPRLPRLDVNRP